jgi:hypothetical protein
MEVGRYLALGAALLSACVALHGYRKERNGLIGELCVRLADAFRVSYELGYRKGTRDAKQPRGKDGRYEART